MKATLDLRALGEAKDYPESDNPILFLEEPKSAVLFIEFLFRFDLFRMVIGDSSGRAARASRLASSLKSIAKAFLKFIQA